MKKLITLKTLVVTAFIALTTSANAQFEGVIDFKKVKGSEITKYTYYVKGSKVRIDEFGPEGKVKGIMLIDTKKDMVTALSPDRKLYMDATNNKPPVKVTPQVTKTSKKQKMVGYDCTEWVVMSKMESTIVSYWVTDETKFSFFEAMLRTLNRKDRLSKYWLEVPGIDGRFTTKGTEKGMDGSVRMSLEAEKIEEKSVEDSLFEIPSNYVKFEK